MKQDGILVEILNVFIGHIEFWNNKPLQNEFFFVQMCHVNIFQNYKKKLK